MKSFSNNENSYIDLFCDEYQCFLIKKISTQEKRAVTSTQYLHSYMLKEKILRT